MDREKDLGGVKKPMQKPRKKAFWIYFGYGVLAVAASAIVWFITALL